MTPAQVDQITVEWLNEQLREAARLTLTYANHQSAPATLIAKCQSIHPENIARYCLLHQAWAQVAVPDTVPTSQRDREST